MFQIPPGGVYIRGRFCCPPIVATRHIEGEAVVIPPALPLLESLIASKTRVKLLLKFFLNSNTTGYLRELEHEFQESTNAIRTELNKLERAGMLSAIQVGNKKVFRANTQHPLFDEIHRILLKQIGLDRVLENVIQRLGNVSEVYLVGRFARGLDSPIIDLIIVGQIDKVYLLHLIDRVEDLIGRKIRCLV